MNKKSSQAFDITADELRRRLDSGQPIMVLDIGEKGRYEKGHIPFSANARCSEETKKNIMPKLPKDMEIVLVSEDEEQIKQMGSMMRKEGLNTRYLKGGLNSWKWDLAQGTDKNISANELKESLDVGKELFLLDVRQPDEFADWKIKGSVNIPLNELSKEEHLKNIPKDKDVVTICPTDNRAMIAKFMLERYGYKVRLLEGGLNGWTTALEYASEEYEIGENRVRIIQVRRIGKGCLSYIIESGSEAVVIDPVFRIDDYSRISQDLGAKITKVYDTHQHADHISAAKALAKETDAELYMSSYEKYAFDHKKLQGGDEHKVGSVQLRVIHTPGHTPGSLSFLIGNKFLITGDTLFVNGVGRPDLRDTASELAPVLYETLHDKLLSLPDSIHILPGHFDGLAKGGKLITATLGDLKENSLLKQEKEEFVKKIMMTAMPTPPHHKQIISVNKGVDPISLISEIHELEMGPNRCSISM